MKSPAAVATAAAFPLALLAGVAVFATLAPPSSTDETPPPEKSLSPVTVKPPAGGESCNKIFDALPSRLADERRRPVTPKEAAAVAWGDPAIVLRCGVINPAIAPEEQTYTINGVEWVVANGKNTAVWTTISLPLPVEVTIPTAKADNAGANVLAPISEALA